MEFSKPVSYTHLDVYKRQVNLRLAGNPILSVIHIQENQILVSCNYIRIIRILGQPHKHTQLCLCIASFHFWIGFIQLPFAEEQVLEFINGTFGEIDIFLRNLVVLGNRVFNSCLLYTSRCV